jgi:hypothetical protein
VAQQGLPPRRHSRDSDVDPRGGYDRAPESDRLPQPDSAPQTDRAPQHGRAPQPGRVPRPERSRRAERHPRPDRAWQQIDAFAPESDTELPPWAGLSISPARPQTGTLRRPTRARPHGDPYDDDDDYRGHGGDERDLNGQAADSAGPADGRLRSSRRRGRAAATRLRKSRRRVYRWCGAAIVLCVVAAGITAIVTHHNTKPALYVTSLQPGEFKSVPDACGSVSTSVLNQFLPGAGRTSTSELAGSTNSQCSFTVDARPNFLVLEAEAEAYEPFAAATGDGSATANAQDNFAQARQGLAHPPKKSPLPPAQISKVTGLGQQAFMAFQDEHVTGIVTDVVTLVVRERNVVITVSMSGQESGHGFGPVPVSTLQAGARAAVKDVLAKVLAQPVA